MNIYFENCIEKNISFNFEEIGTRIVKYVLEKFECPYEITVSVYLVDEEEIRTLNRENRDIDKVTDVLSFPNIPFEKQADFSIIADSVCDYKDPENDDIILGDVVICVKRMEEQAVSYGHSTIREYGFLLTHSLLHLLGYDHIEDEERIVMEKLQSQILDELNITRDI